jgi:hypothetical protein
MSDSFMQHGTTMASSKEAFLIMNDICALSITNFVSQSGHHSTSKALILTDIIKMSTRALSTYPHSLFIKIATKFCSSQHHSSIHSIEYQGNFHSMQ